MFAVKKLNRNGRWDTVSLYDENNWFRGEAKFEKKQQAEEYIKIYKDRINKRLNAEGKSKTRLKLQVFELDGESMIEEKKRKYGRSYYHNISPFS
jgi:hypothetical protein